MRRPTLTPAALIVLMALILAAPAASAATRATNSEVCDANADYFLGVEDYPEAVKTHIRVIDAHPDDALAHYHLGFAYGMLGRHADELAEYRRATGLGLRKWDVFLNLGLAYLEDGKFNDAADAFTTSVALGPNHPEPHFNLALAYERLGMLPQASHQMRTALELDPNQPDAANMLGFIYVEDRNYAAAREIWSDLVRNQPDYTPARTNLAILDRMTDPTRPMTDPASAPPSRDSGDFQTASSKASR